MCDGALLAQDLSESAIAFADVYYGYRYYHDVAFRVRPLVPIRELDDSWQSFDVISRMLDHRFAEWLRRGSCGRNRAVRGRSIAKFAARCRRQGLLREQTTREQLMSEHGAGRVLENEYLRDRNGRRAADPATGNWRCLMHVVMR